MIEISKSDLDRWLEEKRDVAPNTVFTVGELLSEYRTRPGSNSLVKEAGMLTSLRRLGAARKKVSIDGRKLNLWCLNHWLSEVKPGVWVTKCRSKTPKSGGIPF